MARPDKLPRVLTEEETDRLLSEPNQRYFGPHRDYLYMRVMLKAGLRASEATALRPERIDLMSGKLMVREGKGAKDRTLWIGEELLEELQGWMDRRQEKAPKADYLLPTSKGTQVATSHLRRSVKRYARDAGIEEVERVSPHTLRHTFATRLYRSAGKIRLVQKALGHSDLSTTMIYTHVVDEELEGAMKGL
ncbi:tyrosine-type recombinase/integrase [Salinibacter ruber]|uniref:Site-specific recombinase, phage integrase family, truncation n=1 Tax=Salinibacter ruber (strain DSM 13855 / M31) TaxID=309807 RepID=Q2RYL2_SALRD|nr:tyrosine-type recombinase/integrase [Salinibacter ruber]ABC46367.1 site-specific recombinase, phage integrase family, truncation [Salinibacter ruber DSM 13855]